MKMKLSLVFICFITTFSFAQITSRIPIEGKISAPVGDVVEGVVVYNRSTNKGTITDQNGIFNIHVGINDKIEVVSMQYQKFTVLVNKGIIDSKKLTIFLNESVNLLEEVVVTPYDLLGNVSVDVKKINIVKGGLEEVELLTKSRINDASYDWTPDQFSNVHNNAIGVQDRGMINGVNFVNLFKAVLENKNSKNNAGTIANVDEKVRKMYDDQFFRKNLDLEMNQINDFIFFAEDNGLDTSYLQEGKELDLIEFLVSQSKLYKERK
ncbi:hypothetical protein GCM10022393_04430 [Aquimarina addita]|uniref:Carboxypeptidase-like regulatory domain-containing protein n=1 Tax=Aquimarina addita TaxID=870485 RepID=A0ABP7XAR2_9FLAO